MKNRNKSYEEFLKQLKAEDCDGHLNLNDLIDSLTSTRLPNLSMLQLYEGMKDRKLWVEDVDGFLIESVGKSIIKYNMEDKDIPIEQRQPIKLFFNSYGGDVSVCYSLVDIMALSKTPIIGINMGVCYSAGAYIFLSCDERYSLKNSQYLIHQGSAGYVGQTQSVIDHVANLKGNEEKIKAYVLERTHIDEKTYKKNMRTEWYISTDEQIKFGIIDKIVDDIDLII